MNNVKHSHDTFKPINAIAFSLRYGRYIYVIWYNIVIGSDMKGVEWAEYAEIYVFIWT